MGIHNHAVINTGQLLNSKWNWNLRIDKCGKTISCGLNIENHESAVQGLFFRVGDHTL